MIVQNMHSVRSGKPVANHNYSVTTSKYLYQFLGMKRKGIDAMEKVGTLVYTDLNQSMLNPKDLSIYGYEQFIDLFKINMDMIKTINNPVAVSK